MTFQLRKILPPTVSDETRMTRFAVWFIVLFSTQYQLIEPNPGFGVIKFTLMVVSTILLVAANFAMTKALLMGVVYLLYQVLQATFFPETLRWSTLLFSCGLMFMYLNWYDMLYVKKVFTIDLFIRILKYIMMLYFVFCVMQQACLAVSIHYFPLINLNHYLARGIGTNALSMEPSSFARTMLVCYYAYLKCTEYRRGEGPWSIRSVFSGENKWVTIRFLWMMCTMGSGTAFVCIFLLSLYFIRKTNWVFIIPAYIMVVAVVSLIPNESLQRATSAIEATSTLDTQEVVETDGSAAVRIAPMLNSLNVDFTDSKTWFGHGDADAQKIPIMKRTMFDSYGLVLWLIALCFNIICAYRVRSLAFLFLLAGVGGGAGSNIWYAWDLMMIMTGVKYFYDKYHPKAARKWD